MVTSRDEADLRGVLNVSDGMRRHHRSASSIAFLSKPAPAGFMSLGLHRNAHRVGHQWLGTALDVHLPCIAWSACNDTQMELSVLLVHKS